MARQSNLAITGYIFLRLIELHGVDAKKFGRLVGVDVAERPSIDDRFPSDLADRSFATAASLIADPAFALRAAECWHPSHLGTLGYAWMSSGSLRTALNRFVRYWRIIGQRASHRLEDGAEGLRLVHDHGRGDDPVGLLVADYWLSLLVGMCRANFGPEFRLRSVTLRRPQPADPAPYYAFFACPVAFAAAEDGFVIDADVADRPLPSSNRELAHTFDTILTRELAQLEAGRLPDRCRAYLLQELTSGEPSEADLAKAMGMSRRTLQRRLDECGVTFKQLLEQTRYDLALRYLDDPAKSITEITFLLGFSEQSAFTRAFKRWNGKPPSTYRQDARSA